MSEETTPSPTTNDSAPPVPAAELAPVAKPKGPRFAELGLPDHVLKAVLDMGFEFATPVQAATYPLARQCKDLMVQSRTGSGKTAAFGLPFMSGLVDPEVKAVQAIVLLPTRELALQVASELARIAAGSGLTVVPVYGGAPMGRQIELLRNGSQIVCGTPGRVLDHLRRGTLTLDKVRCAVLDECDEMLSMGFQEDIEDILEHTPESRQTLLFSATMPEGIQRLARRFLKKPEILKLSADHVGVQEIKHVYYAIPGISREQELLRILKFENPKSAIIFCNTREETGRVAEFLRQQGIDSEAISSDLSQSDRERVMARMRAASLHFLVATDVAARGIDIERLSHVFNYTFPESPEMYIHRTGRTGRAGRHGTAISLIGPTEVGSFYYLKLAYKLKPEERALPSESEIRSRREGEHITRLRRELTAEPGNEWKGVARRLMAAADGERLIAGLVAAALQGRPERALPSTAREGNAEGASLEAAGATSAERPPVVQRDWQRPDRKDRPSDRTRGRDERRGRDDRPGRDERPGRRSAARTGPAERSTPDRVGAEGSTAERPADRSPDRAGEGSPSDGSRSPERGASERVPERSSSERPPERASLRGSERLGSERSAADRNPPERASQRGSVSDAADRNAFEASTSDRGGSDLATSDPSSASAGPLAPRTAEKPKRRPESSDREFWDVWKDDASTAPGIPDVGASRDDAPADTARLYINLGRKDGAGEAEIRDLLRAHADVDDVRSLEVMNTHTYVNVPAERADAVVAALAGQSVGDRDIICEKAKPRRR